MKLTLQTDYALRVLMYVGMKGGELATIQEIVDAFGISQGHVMKVVHRLGQQGYLDTIRGKHGGIRLAKDPEVITVGGVIRAIEDDLAILDCLEQERFCRIQGVCILKGALREATRSFLATLDDYTLADLLAPRTKLRGALGLPASAPGLPA
jgi:Rrf2 family nitric oxide-sensitive transcriptional repressor